MASGVTKRRFPSDFNEIGNSKLFGELKHLKITQTVKKNRCVFYCRNDIWGQAFKNYPNSEKK